MLFFQKNEKNKELSEKKICNLDFCFYSKYYELQFDGEVLKVSLLSKLEYQNNFTDLEKGIANYIIDHKDSIVDLKITELAEITYTSPSTISRFCRKLGEKNYNDFRIHFAASVMGKYKTKIDYNRPFLSEDDTEQVINKLGNLYKETIEVTKDLLDMDVLEKIVGLLSKVKVIDVYGIGTSYITALNFEQKMMNTPYYVNLKHIPADQNKWATFSNKDTVAIIISYSGESDEIKKIIDYIKDNNGLIIAITSLNDSYLRKNAQYCLTMCSRENIISKIESYSSKVSGDFIMDIIFSMLFCKNYNINLIEKLSRERKFYNKESEKKK